MMRFHAALTGLLATVFVVPAFVGQGQVSSLEEVLGATRHALEVLRGLEERLSTEPEVVKGLILSATEAPVGSELDRDRRLETLRREVGLLQMELDVAQNPALAADGAVPGALAARLPVELAGEPGVPPLTTGLDDRMRSLLSVATPGRSPWPGERAPARSAAGADAGSEALGYSADPLRHGIAAYRAGRYAEAYQRLAALDDASALYWQARALERLDRLDEAVQTMERAIARGGGGFEQRHAEADLDFLRWKREFLRGLPAPRRAAPPAPGTAESKPR